MLTLALLSLAHATTWTVDPSGGGDATTIAEGAGLLSDGDTLSIAAGTYDVVCVSIEANNIRIEGAGWDQTVFDGNTARGADEEFGIGITGENVTVEGVSFQNYTGVGSLETAVDFSGSLAVQNSAFIGNRNGVSAAYSVMSNLSLFDTIFAENEIGVYVPNFIDTLHIENSLFVDNHSGVYQDSYMDSMQFNLIEVVNSTFVHAHWAVSAGGPTIGTASYMVSIVNNIFTDVDAG